MPLSRDERIEDLYNESAWDLAEAVVNLEDENTELRATLTETVEGGFNCRQCGKD